MALLMWINAWFGKEHEGTKPPSDSVLTGEAFFPAWISNHMPSKVWDEMA